jgi:hypothetical protein
MAGRKRWSEADVISEIRRVMDKLGLDRMPTTKEIREHSECYAALFYYGSLSHYSDVMGVPMSRKAKTPSLGWGKAQQEERRLYVAETPPPYHDDGVPDRKKNMLEEARELGTTYAKLQIKETCDAYGRINLDEYAGMKTWRERQEEQK